MRWVVFSNVYVSLCGAALTAATYALWGEPPRVDAVVGLVFFATLVVYNLDRLVEPSPGDSAHERWVDRHRSVLWVLVVLATVASASCALRLDRKALLSLGPAGVVALGYCLPVVRFGGRWRRLKAVPGAKLVLIAGVWTYATAGLPMIADGVPMSADALWVLVARFLFLAAVALPFDLPDAQRDRQAGIATIPTLLGVRATRLIAIALSLGAVVAGAFNVWPAAGAVVLSALFALGLLMLLRPDRGVLYFMVALDGLLLLQAGLLLFVAGW